MITLDGVFSLIFLVDFFVTLYRVPDRRAYLKWGWLDFIGSLPALPWVRPFRVVRAVRILRRVGLRSLLQLSSRQRASSFLWATGTLVIIVLMFASLLILRFEQAAPDANIANAYDALWWAFVTITTVGYGDRYPTTDAGRLLAAVLMTVGVGLFGVLTSYLAATFLSPDEEKEAAELADIKAELREIRQILNRLENRDPPERDI